MMMTATFFFYKRMTTTKPTGEGEILNGKAKCNEALYSSAQSIVINCC